MNVVFRVDSGISIGTGHLTRCLTLAGLLQKNDQATRCVFICRPHIGNVSHMVLEGGHSLSVLPQSSMIALQEDPSTWLGASQNQDASDTLSLLDNLGLSAVDLMIIDHYTVDASWENVFTHVVKKILVIDDLADREHVCDFLIDQNLALNFLYRYDDLVPKKCKKFLGNSFCLLREEFFSARKTVVPRSSIERLLIFFGGIELSNTTSKAILALDKVNVIFSRVDVVVGRSNPFKNQIKELCLVRDGYGCMCH